MQTIKLNWKENVWKSNNEFRFGILVTIDVFTNFICLSKKCQNQIVVKFELEVQNTMYDNLTQ